MTGTTGSRLLRGAWRRVGSRSGSSLIDVLVAVVMVAILIVPIFDAFVRGRSFISHRGETRMALKLVERKGEQLLRAGYGSQGSDSDVSSTNLTSGSHPTDPSILVNSHGDNDTGNDVMGNLTWTVVDVPWTTPGDDIDVKTVTIALVWPQADPRDSVSLTLVVAR